ncbi:hypothetical protein [Lysinibacillus sp. NPDC096212]|uniref:hypothetical protein n=1 Tax=Lysinibacillus sp. NPDC096212 TaxID=3364135 RepID=UPI00380D0517
MSQNIQRTGIFDLNDFTGGIQIPNFNGAFQQDDKELIAPPKFLVDVTELSFWKPTSSEMEGMKCFFLYRTYVYIVYCE